MLALLLFAATKLHAGEPLHGNTKSRVFHRPTCRYYACTNCTAQFATRDEAIAAGYPPGGC